MGTSPETRRLSLVTDVLRSFVDATDDLPKLLATIAERTATLVGVACSIRLLSEDEKTLELAAFWDPIGGAQSPMTVLVQQPVYVRNGLGALLRTGRGHFVETIDPDEAAAGVAPEYRMLLRSIQLQSVLIAPLMARGKLLGAIMLARRATDDVSLTAVDLELAEALGNHAGLAISTARTLQELTREVEQRRIVEGSLAAVEERRRFEKSIVDAVARPLLVIGADERVRSANRAFHETFMTTDAAIIGVAFYEAAERALDEPWIRRVVGSARREASTETWTSPEVVVRVPVLGERVGVVSGRRMSLEAGSPILFTFFDRTDQREDARKLHWRALLLASMSEAVIGTDLEHRVIEWNDAAEHTFGWKAHEVLGRRAEETLHLSGIDRDAVRRDMASGQSHRSRGQIQHRGGRWIDVELSSVPVKENGVLAGAVAVIQDVTDRVRLEDEARGQVRALEEVVDQLDSFASSISHDLRAPLRAIAGFSRLLSEEHAANLDAEGLRLLSVVRRNAERMGLLIDDILTFARVGRCAVKTSDVDMYELVRESLDDAIRDEATREYDIDLAPLPPARADRALIAQVWQNLLGNAVKYTRGRNPARIAITGEERPGEMRYAVKDNGVGFDMRYVDKLFGVFERLHGSEFEGTGVGLALVERIVRRHGGRVWAEAEIDQGATFHFALPIGKGD